MRFLLLAFSSLHVLYAEELAKGDVLAMLQGSLRVGNVQEQGQDSGQDGEHETELKETPEEPLPEGIAKLEELVMSTIREGKDFGDDKKSRTLNGSVNTFLKGIIAVTAANQKQIIEDIQAFKKCKTKMWAEYDAALPMEKNHWVMSTIYPKCITAENAMKTQKQKSDKIAGTSKSSLKTLQKLATAEERKCTNVCNNKKFENFHEQLDKLVTYYGKCKDKIGPRISDVEKQLKKMKDAIKRKKLDDAKYLAMKNKCLKIAYIMNQWKCKAVDTLDGSCSFYEECWKRALKQYEKDARYIRQQERNVKIQWRALKRIQCYIMVLTTKDDKNHKKEKATLDTCIKMKRSDISTKHLDIDYKKIPKKPKCPKDPMCPCSNFYVNSYYKVGPKSRCVKNFVKNYICPVCKKKR